MKKQQNTPRWVYIRSNRTIVHLLSQGSWPCLPVRRCGKGPTWRLPDPKGPPKEKLGKCPQRQLLMGLKAWCWLQSWKNKGPLREIWMVDSVYLVVFIENLLTLDPRWSKAQPHVGAPMGMCLPHRLEAPAVQCRQEGVTPRRFSRPQLWFQTHGSMGSIWSKGNGLVFLSKKKCLSCLVKSEGRKRSKTNQK